MGKLLIAGCGDVGGLLAQRMLARGWQVWGIRRTASKLPSGVLPVAVDLLSAADWTLPEGISHAVFAATPDRRDDQTYRDLYVGGLGRLLHALDLTSGGQSEARVIFVSSTAVYGQDDGSWVDEESPTEPVRFNGQRLLEAEQLLARSGTNTVSLRLGGIYGPSRSGRLIEQARQGHPVAARPPKYTNRIHREDCAGILQHLLELSRPETRYNGVDCEPAPRFEVLSWLRQQMGMPPWIASPPGTSSSLGEIAEGKRVANKKLLASGYRFLYPSYREGYASLLASLSHDLS